MSFLLDTMVVSDTAKGRRDPLVESWGLRQDPSLQFLSAITLGEISLGIERLPSSRKRCFLEAWRVDLLRDFAGRILPVDEAVAEVWGQVSRRCEGANRTMPLGDAYIAATAEAHGLTLVTRNVRDFEAWGGPVFNPWAQASI